MSVTFGFYDSKNHDRKYNAIQMSSIFDGIIRDGVFMSIGTCFKVSPSVGMAITVGTGRAWLNHTWTLNDSLLPLTLKASDRLGYRIDLIVLEVDSSTEVRRNRIYVLQGETGTTPVKPTFTNTANKHTYVLAEISVNPGITQITESMITNKVGGGDLPFVTGILDTINIDRLVSQWEAQWDEFFIEHSTEMIETSRFWENQWRAWFTSQTQNLNNAYQESIDEFDTTTDAKISEMEQLVLNYENQWSSGYEAFFLAQQSQFAAFEQNRESAFDTWFQSIKDIPLNGGDTTEILARITAIEEELSDQRAKWNELLNEHSVSDMIQDSDGDDILDSDGNPIGARVVFEIVQRPPKTLFLKNDDLFYIERDNEDSEGGA